MAGKFVTNHSLAVLKLFEKAPNLIAQLVLKSVTENSDFTSGLVALNLNGYSSNIRKFFNYGKDVYPIGVPASSRMLTQVDETELNRIVQIQARALAKSEAGKLYPIYNSLQKIYVVARDKLAAAERRSDVLLADVAVQELQALQAYAHYLELVAEGAPQEEIYAAAVELNIQYDQYKAAQTLYYNSLIYNTSLIAEENAAKSDYEAAKKLYDLVDELAVSATVTIIKYNMTNTPSNYRKMWEYIYDLAGVILPTSLDDLTGAGLLQNVSGHWPKYYVDHIVETSEPTLVANVITETTKTLKDYTTEGYPVPPSGVYYLEVDYAIDGLKITSNSVINQFVWNYNMGLQTYPKLYPTLRQGLSIVDGIMYTYQSFDFISNCLPIVSIKDDKEWIDTNPDTRSFEAESTDILLEKMNVDLTSMVANFEESEGSEDMDAVYVMFAANLTSKEPSTIRYLMRFFEAMQKDINVFPGYQYEPDKARFLAHIQGTPSLEQQLAAYDEIYPGIPSIADMAYGKYSTYRFDIILADRERTEDSFEEGEEGVPNFQCSMKTGFIYTGIIDGLIEPGAKRGDTMSVWQVGGFNNDGLYEARAAPNLGVFNSGIEYREQIEDNKFKVVRVHNPVISYENYWGGDKPSYMQSEFFLSGTTSRYMDPEDPYANFVIPLNYDIVKTFSNTTETKIYYDTGIAIIFTVIVTFIPGWQTFLKVLLFIVLIIIIIFAPPAGIAILGVTVPVVAIAVVALVAAVIAEILNAALSSELAAKVNTGIAVALAILTLGVGAANLVNLVNSVITLTLDLLGAVTQMVSSIASIVSAGMGIKTAGIMEDTQLLLEHLEEENEEFEAKQLEMFGEDLIDPLMPGNGFDPYLNPSTYFAERLIPNPGIAIYASIQNFYQLAYKLPELALDDLGSVEEK